MDILIFEYVTGGGFNQTAMPNALLKEGGLMLSALLADCSQIASLKVHLMLDSRCQDLAVAYPVTVTSVQATDDTRQVFLGLLVTVDAVWLVAPETDGILQGLTELVAAAGKRLLTSVASAVELTANKWFAYQLLQAANIKTVQSTLLADYLEYQPGTWVIKPLDGVGCVDTWRIDSADDFRQALASITPLHNFLVQPFVVGRSLSLSCLFYQGQGWLLCVNEQMVQVQDHKFQLFGCKVNCLPVTHVYEALVAQLAKAIPGLQGYVGIDIIEAGSPIDSPWVVDINPRLTSSYAGICQALGLNVVELVLQLGQHVPALQPKHNIPVEVCWV